MECVEDSRYADSALSVYRPHAIRCLVNRGGDCSELLACLDDECPANVCEVGACSEVGTTACVGTDIQTCSYEQTVTAFDCGVYGETCKEYPFGGLYCGEEIAQPCSSSRCEGETLIKCTGEEHRIECGALYSGGMCSVRQSRCEFDNACGADQLPTCIGDVLQLCVLGEVVELDCKQIGFVRCSNGACFTY
jgi:hypothetical protein